jgi:ABC-2 type transport system ATP-binding protein
MSTWAVEAENLVKRFPQRGNPAQRGGGKESNGKKEKKFRWPRFRREPKTLFTAVDGVSLQIERGEIFGLLGPNGAGKSTTIRMLCTLLEPTSGTARVNGYDIVKQANDVRRSLGTVLAGERSIYWKLSGRENLEYFAALYHIPPAVAKKRVEELIERMEIKERANELVEKYSTGMRQRIAISKALLARPPILLLDEPTLGLDPQAARNLRELILDLQKEGHTILLTTHYMEEADLLSDRIGIIDTGKIIALDTPEGLKQRIGQKRNRQAGSRGLVREDRREAAPAERRRKPVCATTPARTASGKSACIRQFARHPARRGRDGQPQRHAPAEHEHRPPFAGGCLHQPDRQGAAGLGAPMTIMPNRLANPAGRFAAPSGRWCAANGSLCALPQLGHRPLHLADDLPDGLPADRAGALRRGWQRAWPSSRPIPASTITSATSRSAPPSGCGRTSCCGMLVLHCAMNSCAARSNRTGSPPPGASPT